MNSPHALCFREVVSLLAIAWFAAMAAQSTWSFGQELGSVKNAQVVPIQNVRIASRNSGIVVSIKVKTGDAVSKKQVLVLLDSDVYEAELGVAEHQMNIARSEAEDRSDLEFNKFAEVVIQRGLDNSIDATQKFPRSVSEADIDKQRLELEQTILAIKQALLKQETRQSTLELRQSELRLAKLNLEYRTIASPLGGHIVEIPVQEGEWVNAGQTVARVLDLSRLRVEVFVPVSALHAIALGQKVEFQSKEEGKALSAKGVVTFVSPEINAVNQDFKVWAEFDNRDRTLLPGMVGELFFYDR